MYVVVWRDGIVIFEDHCFCVLADDDRVVIDLTQPGCQVSIDGGPLQVKVTLVEP